MSERWMYEFVAKYLRPGDSCLDLGCGILSWNFGKPPPCSRYLGVDGYQPYLDRISAFADTAHWTIPDDLTPLPDNSYDVVLLLDVLEHLEEYQARDVLDAVDRIARRHVLLVTPDGHHAQEGYDAWGMGYNALQAHRSAWTEPSLQQCGYALESRVEVEAGTVLLAVKTKGHRASLILPYWKRELALVAAFQSMDEAGYDASLEVVVVGDRCAPPDLGRQAFAVSAYEYHDGYPPDTRLNPCRIINYGVAKAKSDVLILSNPETTHTAPIIPQLVGEVERDHSAYVMAAVKESDAHPGNAEKWRQHSLHANWRLHWLTALHRSLYERAGGFDEAYRAGLGYEDNDFVRRLELAGARFVPRDDLVAIHHAELQGEHGREATDDNRRLFESRWGAE